MESATPGVERCRERARTVLGSLIRGTVLDAGLSGEVVVAWRGRMGGKEVKLDICTPA